MVDYFRISDNHNLPELEQEEAQAAPEPAVDVDVVWNVYKEKGDAKSLALKVSIRLPVQS